MYIWGGNQTSCYTCTTILRDFPEKIVHEVWVGVLFHDFPVLGLMNPLQGLEEDVQGEGR